MTPPLGECFPCALDYEEAAKAFYQARDKWADDLLAGRPGNPPAPVVKSIVVEATFLIGGTGYCWKHAAAAWAARS